MGNRAALCSATFGFSICPNNAPNPRIKPENCHLGYLNNAQNEYWREMLKTHHS